MVDFLHERLRPGVRRQLHLRALLEDVEEHAWRRRQRLRSFHGAGDWQRHVDQTRRRFREALGPLPERTPLSVTRTGVLERRGYVVEKLLVETQPGFVATANLYLPAGRSGRAPAVLNPAGHWAHSKAQDVEQARLAGLARRGYAGLIWDPLGQGERSQFPDDGSGGTGESVVPPGTAQHAAVCNAAFLAGSTVIATMLWDGVRLLDYLVSRPEVDPERIACTGVSGGGTYTMFLGAFDSRIKVTVPVCSTSRYERMHRAGLIGDPCQDPVRSYPDDLDMADLLLSHAPAALRIIGTRYDFFPLVGLREAAAEVQDGYAALGIPEKTDLCVVDAHHDYNREQRTLLYAWLDRWLAHEAPLDEAPFEPEPPPALWCTSSGDGRASTGARTAVDLVRDLAAARAAPAAVSTAGRAEAERARVLAAAGRVLGELPPLAGAAPAEHPTTAVHGLSVQRVVVQARVDLSVPVAVFQPPAAPSGPRPLVVVFDDRGKAAEGGGAGLLPALARCGVVVAAADLRGWGETAWVEDTYGWSQDRRDWLSADNMLAYVGYMLGHWSVTQRVHDALAVLRYARSRPDVDRQRVYLVGRGGGAIVALHAAAVDGGVRGVAACDALATYRSVVDAPRYRQPVADFLPGVLLHYDLPDLAAALAPARVLLLEPRDALGEPLPEDAARAAYAGAAQLAALLGGEVRVESGCPPPERAPLLAAWMARDGG